MGTTIVAIGASAGGVEALAKLFDAMPADTGLAFVIVQHLARGRQSMMPEILSSHTSMQVTQIRTGDRPRPNTVHVISPGVHVTIEDGILNLTNSDEDDRLHLPIDLFFKSLAADQGSQAYAIVLSGTGSDGTLGIEAIKAAGGVTLSQRAKSAQFSAMPNNAAETGLIDFRLDPQDIPAKLVQLETWRRQAPLSRNDTLNQNIEARLPILLDRLELNDEIGFHSYKPATLRRRVLRRMLMRHVSSVDEYIELLRNSADERQELARDFLIGVTQFFRNADMFEIISGSILSELLQSDQDEFRIWCSGCSSGEEVYSLAILISELQDKTGDQRSWKLFGTDINPDALATARRGVYDSNALMAVSTDQIERYFENDHGILTVSSRLRSMCVFARHNVLSDPPFSKVDLISCRNLMIYVDQAAQEDIISRFHYSLNPHGFLWLGPSENLSTDSQQFQILDRHARIFKRNNAIASLVQTSRTHAYTTKLPKSSPVLHELALGRRNRVSVNLENDTEQAFLANLAPPFVRISQYDEVLYVSEAARRFLRPAKGIPSPVFEDYFIESVRMPLRLTLKEVRQKKGKIKLPDIMMEIDGTAQMFDLHALPMDEEAKSVLVTFLPIRLSEKIVNSDTSLDTVEATYEAELTVARKRLLARERDFKMAEQELWASNEELLTINEELQSSNEELESSREELHAVISDLATTNAELKVTNVAHGIANSNLQNLIESIDMAIMFVDRKGLIKLFTPLSKDLFSIQDRDIGRSIFDLVTVLDYPDLMVDLAQTEQNLSAFSREVATQDGRRNYIVKIKPYLNLDNKIDGVVVSFFEITDQLEQQWALTLANQQLALQLSELEAFYARAPIGAGIHGPDMRYLRVNGALAEMIGKPASEIIGRHPEEVVPDIWDEVAPLFKKMVKTNEPVLNLELSAPIKSKSPEIRTWIANFFPIAISGSDTIEIAITALEITQQKRLEESLEVKKAELRDAGTKILRNFEHAPFSISIHYGPDHVIVHANQKARQILGTDDPIGKTVKELIPINYKSLRKTYDTVYNNKKTKIDNEVVINSINARGEKIKGVFRRIVQPYHDLDGHVTGVVSINLDISELVAMRDANAQQTLRQSTIIEALDAQIILVDRNGSVLDVNHSVAAATGQSKTELIGVNFQNLASREMEKDAVDNLRKAVETALRGRESRYDDGIVTSAGGARRRVLIVVSPVQSNNAGINEALITITDQTALLDATHRKDILVAELEHRVKNVIATIQAVTRFTASTAIDPETMVEELDERLAAMARSHDKLTSCGWRNQSFESTLKLELGAYASSQASRVFHEGDDLDLTPSTAMLVGLGIHELLTNSVKYGALSNTTGEVHICIKTKDAKLHSLTWTERGGPKVQRTDREGFGTLLLRSILPQELNAIAMLELHEEGLTYKLSR